MARGYASPLPAASTGTRRRPSGALLLLRAGPTASDPGVGCLCLDPVVGQPTAWETRSRELEHDLRLGQGQFRSPEHGDDEANRSNRVDLLRSEDCPSARVHARGGRGEILRLSARKAAASTAQARIARRLSRPDGLACGRAGQTDRHATWPSGTPCAATTLFISPPCFRRAGLRTEPLPAGRAISVPRPQARYKLVPR